MKEKGRINRLPPIAKDLLHKQIRPGYVIQHHPRRFNKPISCKMGVHKGLTNKVIHGILSLYCTKCGEHIAQGIHDKTWTKEEIRKIKLIQAKSVQPKDKQQLLKEGWEALELLRKRYTDEQIRKLIEQYRRGLR